MGVAARTYTVQVKISHAAFRLPSFWLRSAHQFCGEGPRDREGRKAPAFVLGPSAHTLGQRCATSPLLPCSWTSAACTASLQLCTGYQLLLLLLKIANLRSPPLSTSFNSIGASSS